MYFHPVRNSILCCIFTKSLANWLPASLVVHDLGPSDSVWVYWTTQTYKKRSGRGHHHLPKLKEVLKHSDTWHKLTDKDQYEFPGFETDLQSSQKPLANLRDWRRLPFEANTRPHFIWDDNQLPIRGSQTTKHNIIVEGKKTSLYVRRGPCEGVKTCAGPDCEYVVSKRQKINRCLRHWEN